MVSTTVKRYSFQSSDIIVPLLSTDCTIGFVRGPPPSLPIGPGECYTVPENLGPATAYIAIISGSIQGGRQVQVTISTSDGTATGEVFNNIQKLCFI